MPQLLKHPSAFTGPDLPGDPFGKGFLERVSKVNEKTRKAWLRRIESALRLAVPQLKELNYTEEKGRPHLEAICEIIAAFKESSGSSSKSKPSPS